jgi:hypothetical protein
VQRAALICDGNTRAVMSRMVLNGVSPKQLVVNSEHSRTAFSGVWTVVTAAMEQNKPPDYLTKYKCLHVGQWISCDIMEQWIHYLQLGMPDNPGISIHHLAPKKECLGSPKPADKHIDLAEVCLLDSQVSKLILRAHVSGDYKAVLRVMSKFCHFTSVKRILLPLNTNTNEDGIHIAEDYEGTHWILAELHLSSNTVHLFDWIGNSSPNQYQQISGDVVLPPIIMPTDPALQGTLTCHGSSMLVSNFHRESSELLCNACSTTLWTSQRDA